jgi:flagellar hook-associated protein 2
MAMSVDGLVTGMSTTDTINQLMQAEAIPQTALKTKVTAQNKVVSAYQSVNSKLSSLATAAKALGDSNTWGSMKATSNSDAAIVIAQAGAAAGTLSFRVDSLAAAHTVTYSDSGMSVSSVNDTVLSGGTIDIKLTDGSFSTLTPTDGSLKSVVAAINGATDSVYKAAAVQIAPGKYTLQLTAKASGAASDFPAPDGINPAVLGAGNVTTQGSSAMLTIGTTNPYQITSETNTFADVMPGVSVTATREQAATDPRVTVGLEPDTDGIVAKVQAMVDSANAALTEISSQGKVKSGTTAAGPLVGDSTMRNLSQQILGAVSSGAGDLGSLKAVGIGVDRYGKVTFDKDKFTDAYEADAANTRSYFDSYANKTVPVDPADPLNAQTIKANDTKFQPGWDTAQGVGRKLEAIALIASEGVVVPGDPATKVKQGVLQGLIQRRNESIDALNDQVSEWDVRLDLRKSLLQRQFSNLEVAMGKMQQQSSWLAGQISSLPSY